MPQVDSNEIPRNRSYNPGGSASAGRVDRIVEDITTPPGGRVRPTPTPSHSAPTVRRRSSLGIWSVIAIVVLAVIYFFMRQSENDPSEGMNGTLPVQTAPVSIPAPEENSDVEIFTQPEHPATNEEAANQAPETEAYCEDKDTSPDISTQQQASNYRPQVVPPVVRRQVRPVQEAPVRPPMNPYRELKQSFQGGKWRE